MIFHPMVNLVLYTSAEGLWLDNNKLKGTIPNEIGVELTKLSEYYRDCYRVVHIVILIILFDCLRSYSSSFQQ
jgi:hypothetical protein